MVTVESALQTISQHGGCLDIVTGKLSISQNALEKKEIKKAVRILKEAGPDKVKAVLASVQTLCLGCPYHDTGPDSFGKGVIHWCSSWKEANGDTRWLNIAELMACPLDKWRCISNTVH